MNVEELAGKKDLRERINGFKGIELSLLYIDIDHFKRVNDNYSHEQGDVIIEGVVSTILDLTARITDASLYRLGGEEFAVLLPKWTESEAFMIGESMRLAVSEKKYGPFHISVTISIGVSNATRSHRSLVKQAEKALRFAKRFGRNQTTQFTRISSIRERESRHLVLNPRLFPNLDKTLRIAFLTTAKYHHAKQQLNESMNLPLNCVSVLGRDDILVAHFGDRESRFIDDTYPLWTLTPDYIGNHGNPEKARLRFFEVRRILKYHGELGPFPEPRIPDWPELEKIVEGAQELKQDGKISDAELEKWRSDGLVLGIENNAPVRDGEIESYILLNSYGDGLSGPNSNNVFHEVIVKDYILPSDKIFNVLEGVGHGVPAEVMIRARCFPRELFELLEQLHETCARFRVPLSSSTFLVVDRKANRAYQNLIMPTLTEIDKNLRDVTILPLLEPHEQRQSFLYCRPEVQLHTLSLVGRMTKAFESVELTRLIQDTAQLDELKKQAITGTVVGDLAKLRPPFSQLATTCEALVRRLAIRLLESTTEDAKAAQEKQYINRGIFKKGYSRMTFGEARDVAVKILEDPEARTPNFGSGSTSFLESLQDIIEVRNSIAHGRDLTPAEVASALAELLRILQIWSDKFEF